MTPNSFPFVNWDIMIMYPEYKLMYIRPWKTGSTSLLEILRQNFGQGIYYENEKKVHDFLVVVPCMVYYYNTVVLFLFYNNV